VKGRQKPGRPREILLKLIYTGPG